MCVGGGGGGAGGGGRGIMLLHVSNATQFRISDIMYNVCVCVWWYNNLRNNLGVNLYDFRGTNE